MLLYNAHKNSQRGFTMIEILATVIIVGVLSAITAPSFLALFNKNKTNDALNQVRGALQEAQREALRKSKDCKVKISPRVDRPDGLPPIPPKVTSEPKYCLVTGERTLDLEINIRRDNNSLGAITFDFKGRTKEGGSDTEAIIFSLKNDTSGQQRCLMISNPLGVIRSGIYTDSQRDRTSVNLDPSVKDPNCEVSRQ